MCSSSDKATQHNGRDGIRALLQSGFDESEIRIRNRNLLVAQMVVARYEPGEKSGRDRVSIFHEDVGRMPRLFQRLARWEAFAFEEIHVLSLLSGLPQVMIVISGTTKILSKSSSPFGMMHPMNWSKAIAA